MNDKRRVHVSKYLSLHLRHQPERLGLTLEPGGWVAVTDLLAACARESFHLTRDELDEVVATSDKKRFAFDETSTRIRANQGHSTDVDLQLEPAAPPAVLYHGTAARFLDAILAEGLCKMARQHVHLSPDVATARKVGARHGTPAVLAMDAGAMSRDGFVFFCSANGVWLVEHVPARYLRGS
jgi:putative RNA 2'-phosphotransferase